MKIKKLLCVLSCIALCFTCTACNNRSTLSDNDETNNSEYTDETTDDNTDDVSDNTDDNTDDNGIEQGYTVTFVCDEYITVYVYETQDMSGDGTATNTAYSRDGSSGALLNDGNGQVNFKLVFADGYKLASIDIIGGYNNLKGSADTGVENGYRITKITDDLTVTVTSQSENAEEDLTQGYQVTFVCDDHVSVMVYKTQDMTTDGEKSNTAYSRESGTGILTKTDGQVNFVLIFEEGYELAGVNITAGYNNLKSPVDTGVENGYRITKITDDLTVTVTSRSENAEEDLTQGYQVTFVCDDHTKVIIYKTQDTSLDGEETNIAYSRDGSLGTLLKDGTGQVNFKVVCDEGYEVLADNIVISGTYNQNKSQGNNCYRITKIGSELTVAITATEKEVNADATEQA